MAPLTTPDLLAALTQVAEVTVEFRFAGTIHTSLVNEVDPAHTTINVTVDEERDDRAWVAIDSIEAFEVGA